MRKIKIKYLLLIILPITTLIIFLGINKANEIPFIEGHAAVDFWNNSDEAITEVQIQWGGNDEVIIDVQDIQPHERMIFAFDTADDERSESEVQIIYKGRKKVLFNNLLHGLAAKACVEFNKDDFAINEYDSIFDGLGFHKLYYKKWSNIYYHKI